MMRRLVQWILLIFGGTSLSLAGLQLIVYENLPNLEWLTTFEYTSLPNRKYDQRIKLFQPSTGIIEELISFEGLLTNGYMRWSPDGEWLLVQELLPNGKYAHLFRFNRYTYQIETLNVPVNLPASTVWSPDGWWGIVLSPYNDRFDDVYLIKADGSSFRKVAQQLTYDSVPYVLSVQPEQFEWARHSDWFISVTHDYNNQRYFIHQISLDGAENRLLTTGDGLVEQVAISPDNQRLLYIVDPFASADDTLLYNLDFATGISEEVFTVPDNQRFLSLNWVNNEQVIMKVGIADGDYVQPLSIEYLIFNMDDRVMTPHFGGGRNTFLVPSLDGTQYALVDYHYFISIVSITDPNTTNLNGVGVNFYANYTFGNPMWWDEAGNLYIGGNLATQETVVIRISPDFEWEVVLRLEDGQSLIVAFQEPFNDTDWIFLQPDIYQQPEESEFELVSMSRQQFVHYQSDFEIVIPKTWVMSGLRPRNISLVIVIGNLCLISWICLHHRRK